MDVTVAGVAHCHCRYAHCLCRPKSFSDRDSACAGRHLGESRALYERRGPAGCRQGLAGRESIAHYNLAVCLDRLGEKAEAKKHYVTAANLAPGNKVIWDSPPLREIGLNYNIRQKSYLDPNPRGGF
jgi:tetratricopeptide (TPR) repeat protein